MKVVIDTNVVVAGLRSSTGASYRILELIADDAVDFAISVPLFLEYEDAALKIVCIKFIITNAYI